MWCSVMRCSVMRYELCNDACCCNLHKGAGKGQPNPKLPCCNARHKCLLLVGGTAIADMLLVVASWHSTGPAAQKADRLAVLLSLL